MLFLASRGRSGEQSADTDTFLWDPFSSPFDGNQKKTKKKTGGGGGVWGSFGRGRSHYVSVTQPQGEKVLRCFFSTPLGLDKKKKKKNVPVKWRGEDDLPAGLFVDGLTFVSVCFPTRAVTRRSES